MKILGEENDTKIPSFKNSNIAMPNIILRNANFVVKNRLELISFNIVLFLKLKLNYLLHILPVLIFML